MIERDPFSDRILKGDLYRLSGPRGKPTPPPEPDPEVLEVMRRAREKLIREYLKRRRAS